MARLTVDDASIRIEPVPPWRLLRFPAVRLPLESIARADRLPFGALRFVAPGAPELDGTRFYGLVPGDDRLTTLKHRLMERGLTGETVPFVTSWKEDFGNQAVARRPGLIWRDRGWLAFVESAVVFAIPAAIAYRTGVPIWLIGAGAALGAAWLTTGHRLRRK